MTVTEPDTTYDIAVFWDPVRPFAWITSRWVAKIAAQIGYAVDWRFISLRLLNKHKGYDTEFPAGYERGHTAGLRMLRVAAAVRADLGRQPLGALVAAFGASSWDRPQGSGTGEYVSTTEHAIEVLGSAGLPFFGPVISRIPDDREVLPLWEAVTTLAAFSVFAEMKRSLREPPQLSLLGVTDARVQEDWTGGHRAGHLPGDGAAGADRRLGP